MNQTALWFNLLILHQIVVYLWSVQAVQSFAAEHLKTPLGEPVKGKRNKTKTELWIEKFYKKKTNLPEPFPHELVERLEQYLDVSTISIMTPVIYRTILHIHPCKICIFIDAFQKLVSYVYAYQIAPF